MITRTCWINPLCRSIRINKDQISEYWATFSINSWNLIFIDPYWSAQGIDPACPRQQVGIKSFWVQKIIISPFRGYYTKWAWKTWEKLQCACLWWSGQHVPIRCLFTFHVYRWLDHLDPTRERHFQFCTFCSFCFPVPHLKLSEYCRGSKHFWASKVVHENTASWHCL